jgi:hypothetical protein
VGEWMGCAVQRAGGGFCGAARRLRSGGGGWLGGRWIRGARALAVVTSYSSRQVEAAAAAGGAWGLCRVWMGGFCVGISDSRRGRTR